MVESLLIPACSLLLGVLGAVIGTWSIHGRLYSLEDRLNLVEGSLLREVKSRAASERWRKASIEEEAITAALSVKSAGESRKPKWFETLHKPTNGGGA